jgi:glycosyltransferase involved in cell wall biosynthesis
MARSIVFINQATGYLTIDIINGFVKSSGFEEVALITGSVRVQDFDLDESVHRSDIIRYNRGAPTKKIFSWLIGTIQILWLLLTRYRKFEIFYITIPPFAYLLSLVIPNKFSILVYDVYPDILKTFKISPTNIFYRLWAKWNKILFRKCANLYTIGNGMKNLLEQYSNADKIKVVPNWTGLNNLKPVGHSENTFRQEFMLKDKFIILYSGNIGATHNVEALLELAKLLKDEKDVFFMIIGRGERYDHIEKLIAKDCLVNCKILPFQKDNRLNEVIAMADLGVVILNDKSSTSSVPSKLYNLQAVGVPILGIAADNSDLAKHLEDHKTGSCFRANEKVDMVDFIRKIIADRNYHNLLKKNSMIAAKQYTIKNAANYSYTYV